LPTEAGLSKPVSPSNGNRIAETEPGSGYGKGPDDEMRIDHVDAINQMFAEFEFAYHNQFHKAFANPESLIIAKKYWLGSLEHYSPRQITSAVKQVIATQDFLPSIAAMVRACEQGLDLFGLPSARQAYMEACGAPSPKREYDWSHEAVYFAGKSAGWFLLANESEAAAFSIFEYHYDLLCKRVVKGEQLDIELPTPLPEKSMRKLGKEATQARISKLKEELGL